jgi:hypothetical protein
MLDLSFLDHSDLGYTVIPVQATENNRAAQARISRRRGRRHTAIHSVNDVQSWWI